MRRQARAHATGRLTAALGALRSTALRRAFNSLAALLTAGVDPATRALAHLVNRELSRGFVAWSDWVMGLMAVHGVMRRAASHWVSIKLARVFNAWEAQLHAALLMRRAHQCASHDRTRDLGSTGSRC